MLVLQFFLVLLFSCCWCHFEIEWRPSQFSRRFFFCFLLDSVLCFVSRASCFISHFLQFHSLFVLFSVNNLELPLRFISFFRFWLKWWKIQEEKNRSHYGIDSKLNNNPLLKHIQSNGKIKKNGEKISNIFNVYNEKKTGETSDRQQWYTIYTYNNLTNFLPVVFVCFFSILFQPVLRFDLILVWVQKIRRAKIDESKQIYQTSATASCANIYRNWAWLPIIQIDGWTLEHFRKKNFSFYFSHSLLLAGCSFYSHLFIDTIFIRIRESWVRRIQEALCLYACVWISTISNGNYNIYYSILLLLLLRKVEVRRSKAQRKNNNFLFYDGRKLSLLSQHLWILLTAQCTWKLL